jgi:hypothetical protein
VTDVAVIPIMSQRRLVEAFSDNPPPGMTVASAHAPFGYAMSPKGGVLHRVNRVVLAWHCGQVERVLARWACKGAHGGSHDARLVHSPHGFRWCARCDIANADYGTSLLYVAVRQHGFHHAAGPVIKVGFTRHIATRMRALKAAAVVTIPGGPVEEQALIDELEPFLLHGREWFSLDALPTISEALGVPLSLPDEVAS